MRNIAQFSKKQICEASLAARIHWIFIFFHGGDNAVSHPGLYPQLTRDMGGRKDLENVSVPLSKRLWPGAIRGHTRSWTLSGSGSLHIRCFSTSSALVLRAVALSSKSFEQNIAWYTTICPIWDAHFNFKLQVKENLLFLQFLGSEPIYFWSKCFKLVKIGSLVVPLTLKKSLLMKSHFKVHLVLVWRNRHWLLDKDADLDLETEQHGQEFFERV